MTGTWLKAQLPGIALAVAIGLVATALGRLVPIVGGPVFGILIGALLAAVIKPGAATDAGAKWAGKRILQASIVVLGTGLSLGEVAKVGLGSLPVMLGTLAVALIGAWLLGRALGITGDLRTLIGVGTGICGASAIAATTAVIGAAEADVAYAVGTIFTFNIVAVLAFPAIGHLLGMSQHAFGLWAGTAINDTSSVVAASSVYGAAAGSYGVVVKLTRTLMIVPITVALSLWGSRRAALAPAGAPAAPAEPASPPAGPASAPAESASSAPALASPFAESGQTGLIGAAEPQNAHSREAREAREAGGARRVPWKSIVPMFLVWFLVASLVDTLGWVPGSWHPALAQLGSFLITVALSGIGLGTRLSTLRAAGARPLLLGGMLWVLVALASLGLQALTGTL